MQAIHHSKHYRHISQAIHLYQAIIGLIFHFLITVLTNHDSVFKFGAASMHLIPAETINRSFKYSIFLNCDKHLTGLLCSQCLVTDVWYSILRNPKKLRSKEIKGNSLTGKRQRIFPLFKTLFQPIYQKVIKFVRPICHSATEFQMSAFGSGVEFYRCKCDTVVITGWLCFLFMSMLECRSLVILLEDEFPFEDGLDAIFL